MPGKASWQASSTQSSNKNRLFSRGGARGNDENATGRGDGGGSRSREDGECREPIPRFDALRQEAPAASPPEAASCCAAGRASGATCSTTTTTTATATVKRQQ